MEKTHLLRKPKVFYGYWIVGATFFCLFIYSGCGFYAFSLFVKPLQVDLGWGRGEIMAAFTILFLVSGVASPFVGKVVDRYGARRVISIGAAIVGLGFILLSVMSHLWHFYVVYAVIGVGITAMGQVPASAIVSNWFEKRRGLAIGIMSIGIGIGGFALAPLVGGYIIPSFGWRISYLVLALLTWLLIIPLALLVIKTRPADTGLYPDGRQAPDAMTVAEASPLTAKGLTLKMALATSAFWLICISFLLSQFSQVGLIQSQVPHLEDIGFPVVTAATALGFVGLASAVGKFGFGWLCDRIPAKYACSIGLGFMLTGITIFINIRPASPVAIVWLYALTTGLGSGSWLPTMSMLVSTNFGLVAYGTIFGVVSFFQNLGMATGPLMAGYIYDTMNTYHMAFITFLALFGIAIPAMLAVRRPKALVESKRG